MRRHGLTARTTSGSPRALVVGTGWAGEGHCLALRHAGVVSIALCGRSAGPAARLASRLRLAEPYLDWRAALAQAKPDIVALATTVEPHREMALAAAEQGCHVVCEKPLANGASDARAMLAAVRRAGVCHAYAASHSLQAEVSELRARLAAGAIGELSHIEVTCRPTVDPAAPYHWSHRLADGGGALNTIFTHLLHATLRITGSRVLAAGGLAWPAQSRAPLGGVHHDTREHRAQRVDLAAADLQWRPVDADGAVAAMVQLAVPPPLAPAARAVPAIIEIVPAATGQPGGPPRVTVHGSAGTVQWTINGATRARLGTAGRWRQVTPAASLRAEGGTASGAQFGWNVLFARLVGDIAGDCAGDYPTFADGYVACQVIDAIRSGRSLTPITLPD